MSKKTVLIVEDERILREIIREYFVHANYHVLESANGEEAMALFEKEEPDLILLDIMLPKLDGWSMCRRIRKKSDVPIIMLTARADEDDMLLGFELGADDYVTKPYSPPVLLARAKRLLDSRSRRIESPAAKPALELLGIRLDWASRTVSAGSGEVFLTHTEFEILACLMQHPGIVMTREQLISRIWGYEYAGDDRTLNTHIRNIRAKLGDQAKMIQTIVRVGYRFGEKP